MGERATLYLGTEMIEWRNTILAERGTECGVTDEKCRVSCDVVEWRNTILGGVNTARDQIGVSVPKCVTERSEWTLQCERSELLIS